MTRWLSGVEAGAIKRASFDAGTRDGSDGGGRAVGGIYVTYGPMPEVGSQIIVGGGPSYEQLNMAGDSLEAILVPFAGLPPGLSRLLREVYIYMYAHKHTHTHTHTHMHIFVCIYMCDIYMYII